MGGAAGNGVRNSETGIKPRGVTTMENEEAPVTNSTKLLPVETVKQKISGWLINYLANLTEIPVGDIDIHSGFDRYGFDSYQGVVMTNELGERLRSVFDLFV